MYNYSYFSSLLWPAEKQNNCWDSRKAGEWNQGHRRVQCQHTRKTKTLRWQLSSDLNWILCDWFLYLLFCLFSAVLDAAYFVLTAIAHLSDCVSIFRYFRVDSVDPFDTLLYIFTFHKHIHRIIFLKRAVAWHYQRKLNKNSNKLNTLRAEKKKILENVMDKETYKVGFR